MGNTEEIQALIEAVREAIHYTLAQEISGAGSIFPLYNCKQVAKVFGVSPATVRSWARMGELSPRYQVLSGRCFRLIFTTQDLLAFFDRNFPSEVDLAHPCDPRSRKGALIAKVLKMQSLYARRRKLRE